jgi:predicted RNase H-like HicB family nuclease
LEEEQATVKYTVVLEQGRRNWSAYVPDVPGCISTGKTRADTERNIQEALALHLKSMLQDGDPIPAPGTWTTDVEIDLDRPVAETSAARVAG